GNDMPLANMCPAVAAPIAANDIWHSEIWPDIQTNIPSEANTMKYPSVEAYCAMSVDGVIIGTSTSSVVRTANPAPVTRWLKVRIGLSRRALRTPRSVRYRAGTIRNTTNSTRNGALLGRF